MSGHDVYGVTRAGAVMMYDDVPIQDKSEWLYVPTHTTTSVVISIATLCAESLHRLVGYLMLGCINMLLVFPIYRLPSCLVHSSKSPHSMPHSTTVVRAANGRLYAHVGTDSNPPTVGEDGKHSTVDANLTKFSQSMRLVCLVD